MAPEGIPVNSIPSPEEIVSRGRAMIPTLRERNRHCEELRRIPPETIEDFRKAGFFRIAQPKRFQGYGYSVDVIVEMAMEIGRGCGSSAWMAGQWPGHQWIIGCFPLQAQEEYWATGPDTLSSTASAIAKLKAEPERGGWRIRDTQMRFSSGCDAAQWIILTIPPHGTALVPKSDFRVLDDWYVSGLRGTGSKSIVIEDAWIPPHRFVPMDQFREGRSPGAELYPDMPNYRAPYSVVLNQMLLGPVIGMARGVLDRFEERVTKRMDLHTMKPASEGAGPQLRFAESHAEIETAMMFIRRNCQTLAAWGTARHAPTLTERAHLRRDITYAAKMALQATNRLTAAGDASGMFDANDIGRLARDVQMGCLQFVLTWDEPAQSFSRTRWGLPPSSLMT